MSAIGLWTGLALAAVVGVAAVCVVAAGTRLACHSRATSSPLKGSVEPGPRPPVTPLGQAQACWEMTFDRSPVGIAIIGPDGRLARSNDALARALGRAPGDLEGHRLTEMMPIERAPALAVVLAELLEGRRESASLEQSFSVPDGSTTWAQLAMTVIRDQDGGPIGCLVQVQDTTLARRAEQLRAHSSLHDGLTGLPNGTFMDKQMMELLRVGRPFGVAYFDLYRFRTVNDSLGRAAGDELMQDVARRVGEVVRNRCTLGRFVGDEFVLVRPGDCSPAALLDLGAAVVSALSEPFLVRGHEHAVGVTVGVTASKPSHRHPDEVLREAHSAMLRSKAQGRGRIEMYDPDHDNPATVADLELEDALRQSLAQGVGVVPHFQPIVALSDRTVVGHEALARWVHPQLGLLEPPSFIPLAERSGLVVPLGWHMLRASCEILASEGEVAGGSGWLSVNVSAGQLGHGQLLPAVRHAIEASGAHPSLLHLEITETALVRATDVVVSELSDVVAMGVTVALDDFGTGYSSLSMLRDLPVHVVKIDRGFVAPLLRERGTAAIVHRLIELCQDLGIVSIAEGIETDAQAEHLRRAGCLLGQGYLFGRPAPAGEGLAGARPRALGQRP